MTGFHGAQRLLEYSLPAARSYEGNAVPHLTLWPINTAGSADAHSGQAFDVEEKVEKVHLKPLSLSVALLV